MIHLVINLLIFVVVAILSFGLLVAYVIGRIFRGVWLVFSRLTGVKFPYQMPPVYAKRCMQFRCGARNPADANYCRRCGTPLPRPFTQAVSVDPAARKKWVSSSVSI